MMLSSVVVPTIFSAHRAMYSVSHLAMHRNSRLQVLYVLMFKRSEAQVPRLPAMQSAHMESQLLPRNEAELLVYMTTVD
jgi:hypothetical protein